MITPGSDALSLLALFVPMHLLFEIGLLTSRLFVPKPLPPLEIERD
jgi:Sec-independent protein secretion pathway component TatC